MFSWKHGVVAIDHGCILTGPLWTSQSLNSTHDYENKACNVVNNTPLRDSEKSALQAAAEVMLDVAIALDLDDDPVVVALAPVGGDRAHRAAERARAKYRKKVLHPLSSVHKTMLNI